MAAESETTSDDSDITFEGREIAALREIVVGWLNERIVTRPYPPEVLSVIEKLGLTREAALVPELLPPIQLD
jgi:hypothetical protein